MGNKLPIYIPDSRLRGNDIGVACGEGCFDHGQDAHATLEVGEEGQGGGFGDGEGGDLAYEGGGAIEDDDVVAGGAAYELGVLGRMLVGVEVGLGAEAFDEDGEGSAYEALVVVEADGVLEVEEGGVALSFGGFGDVVGEIFFGEGVGAG